ncbi:MAG: hypothetical protein KGI54_12605 [Pseudomonadota bacterium]|nr:hypothetical protein [Pseudomonadota bacterium]
MSQNPPKFLTDLKTGEISHILKEFPTAKQWVGPFGFLFINHNLSRILEMKLTATQFSILLILMAEMSEGKVEFNAQQISKKLKITRETASRIKSKFLKNEILIKNEEGDLELDARLFWKGKFDDLQAIRQKQHLKLVASK